MNKEVIPIQRSKIMETKQIKSVLKLFRELVLFIKKEWRAILLFFMFASMMLLLLLMYNYINSIFKEVVVQEAPSSADVKKGAEADTQIAVILEETLDATNGDRAYVFQYHNTIKSTSGIHFRYLSNTHEVTYPGVSQEINNFQNIPASVATDMTNTLLSSQPYCYDNLELISDKALKQILMDQQIKAICLAPLKDDEQRLSGFIGVDYVNKVVPKDLFKLENLLHLASVRVSDILYVDKFR